LKHLYATVVILSFAIFTTSYAKDNSKYIANQALLIKKSSQKYFSELGYWPANITELINSNYLQYDKYNDFELQKNNADLVIVVKNISQYPKLGHYLIDGMLQNNSLLLTVPPTNKANITILPRFFCSNLFCRTE
jgi:hypothetical protein